jgi:hypothetical protein
MRCAESKCKRAHLLKRFESLLHWQCFVERCAVPPLAAALGFSCEGLTAASTDRRRWISAGGCQAYFYTLARSGSACHGHHRRDTYLPWAQHLFLKKQLHQSDKQLDGTRVAVEDGEEEKQNRNRTGKKD